MSSNICKICGSAALRAFKSGNVELMNCTSCSVSFLAEMPSAARLDKYYTENYTLKKNINGPEHELRRIFRLPEQIKLISDLLKVSPAKGTILDIGCDRGFFLDEARRFGYTVIGVEPSESGRSYCTAIGITTYKNIEQVQVKADIITLWHTLEHVQEPIEFIKKIHSILNVDGIIAIRIPDYGSFKSKILGKWWVWFQPENHYFHYTATSLRILLEKTGFTVVTLQSQQPNDNLTKKSYSLAYWIFKKYFGRKMPLRKKAGRLYEGFAGVELYAVAKKNN